jgi:iron complex outermembrane receptor protein
VTAVRRRILMCVRRLSWEWFLVLAAVLFLEPGSSVADEGASPVDTAPLSEETLLFSEIPSVYGASKYEQKVTEAPSSVSIVTAEEISRYGYRIFADILRSIRGFYTTYDRNYGYVGIRGFGRPGDYNSRVLLLIDGHRINDSVYDAASIYTAFPLDVDLIDRVEVIRGPSSSIYGTSAFFGVINVVTKRGRDIGGIQASGETASHDTLKGRATLGDRLTNGLEYILSGTSYGSDGRARLYYAEFDEPSTNNGVAEDQDNDEFQSVFATLAHRDLTLQGAYVSRSKEIPTAAWGTVFNRAPNQTFDDQGYLDLMYQPTLFGRIDLTAKL